MQQPANIKDKIRAYFGKMTPHHRYRSWEHCFTSFHRGKPVDIDRDHAALQLGFYLASWGMYRGSGFLIDYDYTIHLAVIDALVDPRFSVLWEREFGAGDDDSGLVGIVRQALEAVREAYKPHIPTYTLVTKILLGTFGCLPACDFYFLKGIKDARLKYSFVGADFVERMLGFCRNVKVVLREEQQEIERTSGVHYPLMKLVDMYFWQIGFESSEVRAVVNHAGVLGRA